jgi:hypothetical protein
VFSNLVEIQSNLGPDRPVVIDIDLSRVSDGGKDFSGLPSRTMAPAYLTGGEKQALFQAGEERLRLLAEGWGSIWLGL